MKGRDRDLQARFDALRRVDGPAVPDLDAIVAKAPARRQNRIMLPATVAAAAVVMLVAGLRFVTPRPSATISVSPSEPSLLAWRSPTASLLETPGRELLQTVPTVRSSLLRSVP